MKMRSRTETRALHERKVEDRFAAYELTDSEDFDRRQMARNILRYQVRGYCFELQPTCSRWGKGCFFCPHVKCRENELYDGEKWNYDFDPDIDRFSRLFDNIQDLAAAPHSNMPTTKDIPPKVDTERSLTSLLTALAGGAKTAVP